MASVRKRKWTHKGVEKEAWVVTYTDPSSGKRVQGGAFDKKKDADKERLQIETEIERGDHTARNSSATLKSVCDEYLRNQDQRVRDGVIRREWRTILERVVRLHILPYLGSRSFSDLQQRDVEKWWSDLAAAGKSNLQTRKGYLEIVRQIEDLAIRKEYTKKHIFKTFRPERAVSRAVINTFTVDDIKTLIEALKTRPRWLRSRMWLTLKCAVYLSAFCGLRRGEIFGLKAENFDFNNRLIKVRTSLTARLELKGPKTRSAFVMYPCRSR